MHCLTFGPSVRCRDVVPRHLQHRHIRFHWHLPCRPPPHAAAPFRSRIRDGFVTVFIAFRLRHFCCCCLCCRCCSLSRCTLRSGFNWPPGQSTLSRFSVHLHTLPHKGKRKPYPVLRFNFWDELSRLWLGFAVVRAVAVAVAVGSGCSIRLVFSALYDFCMFALLRFSNTHISVSLMHTLAQLWHLQLFLFFCLCLRLRLCASAAHVLVRVSCVTRNKIIPSNLQKVRNQLINTVPC